MQAILEVQHGGIYSKLYAESGMWVVVAHTPTEKWHLRMLASELDFHTGSSNRFVVIDLPESWPFQNTIPVSTHAAA